MDVNGCHAVVFPTERITDAGRLGAVGSPGGDGILEQVIGAGSLPLLGRLVRGPLPPDVGSHLGGRARPVGEVPGGDAAIRQRRPQIGMQEKGIPNNIRLCVPGSAADGATIAVAPVACTAAARAWVGR